MTIIDSTTFTTAFAVFLAIAAVASAAAVVGLVTVVRDARRPVVRPVAVTGRLTRSDVRRAA